MFRKLTSLAAVAVATTALLTGAATPAHAEGDTLTITIGYDGAAPTVSAASDLDPGALVASVTGIVDGELIDASSCSVDSNTLEALLSGGSATVIGGCDGAGIAATLLPQVGTDGLITVDGGVSAGLLEWEVRGKCKGRWLFGIPVWVECEVTVTVKN